MRKLLLIIIFTFVYSFTYATHNRAGEITYKQLSALQYEFTLTTFTDISNAGNADRPTATLLFGMVHRMSDQELKKTMSLHQSKEIVIALFIHSQGTQLML